MQTITLFDRVSLTHDLPEGGLQAGAEGVVIDTFTHPPGYMVQFYSGNAPDESDAVADDYVIADLPPDAVRLVTPYDRVYPHTAPHVVP